MLRLDLLGAMLLAVVCGGAVGLERELRGKAAGLRTNILICVGAALFTQLSIEMADGRGDPARLAAQIVTGVGFIGAGTILHSRGAVTGLTSAATIWVVAAIGVALGSGAVLEGVGVTLLLLLVLRGLGWLEGHVRRRAVEATISVEVPGGADQVSRVEEIFQACGLAVADLRVEPAREGRVVLTATVRGKPHQHDEARLELLRATRTYRLSINE
ncbi:MAG: MgtC/SapB family protein [Gemmatimonadota bacterium]|nr:MgtC/SapB family protein [Gemmatimonadota bacterium]